MGNKLGLALVSSLAASAVLADVAVGFKERGVVDVPSGTAASARTLVGDRGTLYKTGAGALDVAAAGLRAPMALRLMRVGKMNPLDSHPVNKEIDTIRKIVKNAEAASKEEN